MQFYDVLLKTNQMIQIAHQINQAYHTITALVEEEVTFQLEMDMADIIGHKVAVAAEVTRLSLCSQVIQLLFQVKAQTEVDITRAEHHLVVSSVEQIWLLVCWLVQQ